MSQSVSIGRCPCLLRTMAAVPPVLSSRNSGLRDRGEVHHDNSRSLKLQAVREEDCCPGEWIIQKSHRPQSFKRRTGYGEFRKDSPSNPHSGRLPPHLSSIPSLRSAALHHLRSPGSWAAGTEIGSELLAVFPGGLADFAFERDREVFHVREAGERGDF